MIKPHFVIRELNYERIAGSEGEKKAAHYLCDMISSFGFTPVKEEFPIVSFTTGTATICVNGKNYHAHPFGINMSSELNAECVFIPNPAELHSSYGKYAGKIVVMYGYDRSMYHVLRDNEIAGCITIGAPLREASSWSHRQKAHKDGYIPSVSVDYATGLALSKMDGAVIHLTITQDVRETIARNIIVDVPGTGLDRSITYMTGHYDTVARSEGATDNAGGVAVMLSVLEMLSKKRPSRRLTAIFCSAEELGLRGSLHYTETHKEEVQKYGACVVNIDVAGDMLGTDCFIVTGTHQQLGYYDGITREEGMVFRTSLDIYSSDAMPFAVYEIPSVNIARFGGEGTLFIHTPADIAKRTNERGLMPTVKATKNLITRLLNAPVYPIMREIDSSLREKIEKYMWNCTYEEPKLLWKEKYKRVY